MILVDTGPLVADADADDDNHERCRDFLVGCNPGIGYSPVGAEGPAGQAAGAKERVARRGAQP